MTHTSTRASSREMLAAVWREMGADSDQLADVELNGPSDVLPAAYDVTGLAAASIGAALRSAALFHAHRTQTEPRPITVNTRHAGAAFLCDQLFEPLGWTRPPTWDAIAGNYRTADGWIRLHTNYRYHRQIVEKVLAASDRASVEAAVISQNAEDIEHAVISAGGCAAAMHTRTDWLACAVGAATAHEPIVRIQHRSAANRSHQRWPARTSADHPFEGLRVLDLTRVIAGPVATRLLSGLGAEVLRIDPPGFDEVASLLPETTSGKFTAMLDLRSASDQKTFESLLHSADVLVHGLRPGALSNLGYHDAALHDINPDLVTASLNAYGWEGPWRSRRGFDSLVQMSSGIAAPGGSSDVDTPPRPLPAQALDHATGYVLAGAVAQALDKRMRDGTVSDIRCSLIGTANFLLRYPTPEATAAAVPGWTRSDTRPIITDWGPARHVPPVGDLAGIDQRWRIPAGPLGRHPARWHDQGR